SPNAPDESNVGVGIHEHLHVAAVAYALVHEEQDSIDHHDVDGFDALRALASRVRHEIVDRLFDGLTLQQLVELREQQLPIERVGMIPIDAPTLLHRQMGIVAVVPIHVDERHRLRRQSLRDIPRDGGLAGAGSSGDADDQRLHESAPIWPRRPRTRSVLTVTIMYKHTLPRAVTAR